MDAKPEPTTDSVPYKPPHLQVKGDYILREKIGGGSSSAVWRANHRYSVNEDVALKQVYLSKLTPTLKLSLDCEIKFLSTVHHPNIIRLFDFFQVCVPCRFS